MMQNIKNIIFDLGNVLLDIDFSLSEKAFERLGIYNFREMVSPTHSNDLFNSLETGLDSRQFYEKFRKLTGTNLSNETIEEAWCALLQHFRTGSIERLQQLKPNYKTYLLSNTNEIHVQRIHQQFRHQFNGRELDDCFDAAYYSQRIQIRKPDAKAWLHILNNHQLNAGETLFIDDGLANIVAAQQLGMQTIHLLPGMNVEDLSL
jgi:glucose-1-phosphatase